MKKAILIYLLVWAQSLFALTARAAIGEATVLDFDWKPATEIPADIVRSKSFTRWKKNFAAEPKGWAEFDLDGSDRTREVIIDEWDFPAL